MRNIHIISTLLPSLLMISCTSGETANQTQATSVANVQSITAVIGQARIEPERKITNLATPVNGIVKAVLKAEGDLVTKGEVIVELEHDIQQAKLAQIQSRLKTQLAKIKNHEYEVAEFKARLSNKEKEFIRLSALLSKGSETQQRVDDVETEMNVFKTSLQRASVNFEIAKSESIEIQKEYGLALAELNQRIIKSPAAGRLLAMSALPGASLETQNYFAEFAPEGRLIARAEIDELFADQLKVGQQAEIRLVGSEEPITTGKVIYAAPSLKRKSLFSETAGDQEDRRVREIKIQLDDPKSLLINARVECVIKTGR